MDKKEQTPLMKQFWEIKSLHEDKILLFRMGDFFEMFFDDAVKAAPILGIALTSRNKKSQDETPMCGVPHHSIAGPINKLLAAGLKVAICDQIEDPKFAKGIVKRAVTRVLTPGMVYDAETLDATIANYIASWTPGVLACLDATTGEAIYWEGLNEKQTASLISLLPIAEFVLAEEEPTAGGQDFPFTVSCLISRYGHAGMSATDRLRAYVQSLGTGLSLELMRPFEKRVLQGRLELSTTVLRHLEILQSTRGDSATSLYAVVDRTKTSLGARRLRSLLAFPETTAETITNRWNHVERWVKSPRELENLRSALSGVGDLERRLTRLAPSTANGRDLRSIQESLQASLEVLRQAGRSWENVKFIGDLAAEIEATIVDEPPLSVRQGYVIKNGVSAELDEAIKYSTQGQEMLAELESRERMSTGISSLKIRYNNVFGYYIEITNTHKDKAPSHYQRKQTLANAERFTTDELVELERRLLSAQSRRFDLELGIFENLKARVIAESRNILELAQMVGGLDVTAGFARLAVEQNYVRPQISRTGVLRLKASRHPVVEQKSKQSFVANDITLEPGACLLLTGPNMAGKSTLMRQVALTVVLAQAGSFVPASEAELPIYDRILTRIGAQDSLAEGLSTFMVEMKETAEILEKADRKSLVILDEIGRGTSTFDGMSLAQAILEHLLQKAGSTLFFATHYHELTQLAALFPQIQNGHMAISEKRGAGGAGEIRFLYSLRSGPAQKSYGIHVAQLAGLPKSLTDRAQRLLIQLETPQGTEQLSLMMSPSPAVAAEALVEKAREIDPSVEKVLADLRGLTINSTTPLEALMKITEWQSSIQD